MKINGEFKLTPVGARRLETLAAFLHALPRKAFDIGSWLEKPYSNDKSREIYATLFNTNNSIKTSLDPAVVHSCGASACAFGWAATIPKFRRAGLTMSTGRFSSVPTFRGFHGFDAAAKFFHLSDDWSREENSMAHSLFSPDSYGGQSVTPKVVALRIRKLLKDPAKYNAALSGG